MRLGTAKHLITLAVMTTAAELLVHDTQCPISSTLCGAPLVPKECERTNEQDAITAALVRKARGRHMPSFEERACNHIKGTCSRKPLNGCRRMYNVVLRHTARRIPAPVLQRAL